MLRRIALVLASFVMLCDVRAEIVISDVQIVDVTPSSAALIWRVDTAAVNRVSIYSDAAGSDEITSRFRQLQYPVEGVVRGASDALQRAAAKAVIVDGAIDAGLVKVRIENLSPNSTYHVRVHSESATDSGEYPSAPGLLSISTPLRNSLAVRSKQLLVQLEGTGGPGWLATARVAGGRSPISAFLGDGAGEQEAVLNLSRIFIADDQNFDPMQPSVDVTVELFGPLDEYYTQTIPVSLPELFQVAVLESIPIAGLEPIFVVDSPRRDSYVGAGPFAVRWHDQASGDARISLYYEPDAGGPATLIVADLSEQPDGDGDRYLWDPSAVPDGIYRLFGVMSTGSRQITAYAPGRVGIDNGQLSADGDPLPDVFERLFGLNPADPGDAFLDPDGDGRNSVQELIAGTHPGEFENHAEVPMLPWPVLLVFGSVVAWVARRRLQRRGSRGDTDT
ncbi:MAG: hypothetical protein KDK91_03160 [Gammaproteobacteria bacterium]|nr:hypothetical protein [Gammaproteobacteria bacterium]